MATERSAVLAHARGLAELGGPAIHRTDSTARTPTRAAWRDRAAIRFPSDGSQTVVAPSHLGTHDGTGVRSVRERTAPRRGSANAQVGGVRCGAVGFRSA